MIHETPKTDICFQKQQVSNCVKFHIFNFTSQLARLYLRVKVFYRTVAQDNRSKWRELNKVEQVKAGLAVKCGELYQIMHCAMILLNNVLTIAQKLCKKVRDVADFFSHWPAKKEAISVVFLSKIFLYCPFHKNYPIS